MVKRLPVLYCSVCGKLVVMNVHGTVTQHWAEGDTVKKAPCSGSEKAGTLYPG